MEDKERKRQYDVLRGIAIIFVIIIHVTVGYAYADKHSLTYGIMNFVNKLFYGAVPTFLTLTLFLGLRGGKKRGAGYVFNKCGRIAVPYIIWSGIYIFLGILVGDDIPSVKHLILNDLLQGEACYHLYYIVLLAQLYVFIALASRLPHGKIKPHLWQPFAAVVLQQVILVAFTFIIIYRFWFYNTALLIFFYCVPLAYGLMLASDEEATMRLFERFRPLFAVICILSAAAMAVLNTYGNVLFGEDFFIPSFFEHLARNMFYFGSVPLMFLLSRRLEGSEFLNLFGKRSLEIYFIHPLFLAGLGLIIPINSLTPLELVLVMGVKLVTVVSILVLFIILNEKCNNLLKNLGRSRNNDAV